MCCICDYFESELKGCFGLEFKVERLETKMDSTVMVRASYLVKGSGLEPYQVISSTFKDSNNCAEWYYALLDIHREIAVKLPALRMPSVFGIANQNRDNFAGGPFRWIGEPHFVGVMPERQVYLHRQERPVPVQNIRANFELRMEDIRPAMEIAAVDYARIEQRIQAAIERGVAQVRQQEDIDWKKLALDALALQRAAQEVGVPIMIPMQQRGLDNGSL